MMSAGDFIRHKNNFSILRLAFAALVITSHSSELIDGNRSREILTNIFGTISFGEFGVDSFFVVSGFLIAKSLNTDGSMPRYFAKRLARILPGYLVCFSLCFFVLAPLVGGTVNVGSAEAFKAYARQVVHLLPPTIPGTFNGLPYSELNRSMWTIAHEFRCYVLAAVIQCVSPWIPARKYILFLTVLILLAASSLHVADGLKWPHLGLFLGRPADDLRLIPIFGVGSLMYVFHREIPFTPKLCIIAAICLVSGLSIPAFAEPSTAVFGGYLILFAAFFIPVTALSHAADRTDISYGLYLYAWPTSNVLIWVSRGISPLELALATTALSGLAGFISWHLVERPCLLLTRRRPVLHPPLSETHSAA